MEINDFEFTYLSLIDNVLHHGKLKKDRTTVGSNMSTFGTSMHFYSKKDTNEFITAPFMQSRVFAPRIAFEELMWMMNGRTDVKFLHDRNIHIWDGNTSQEYLQQINKTHIEEGTIGKGYGYQFRNFNGIDQLKVVFDGLKKDPYGRKHVISLWNPADFKDMALEPCHHQYNFYVIDNKLCLNQHMRSSDIILGKPYNMAFTSFMCSLFAKALNMEVGDLWFTAVDNHIYTNLIDIAKEQVKSIDKAFSTPKYKINKDISSFDEMLSVEWKDIEIIDFVRGPKIGKPEMAV